MSKLCKKTAVKRVKVIAEKDLKIMKRYFRKITSVFAALILLAPVSCRRGESRSTADIPAVKDFDAARYMGSWYEIARLPNSFERSVTDAQALYTLQDDGSIKVLNTGFIDGKKTYAPGKARLLSDQHTGELEVSFFGPFYSLYKIIYLNKDYTLAIVTSSSMDYLWILARTPLISRDELMSCIKMLKQWGFRIKLLQYPSGMIEKL